MRLFRILSRQKIEQAEQPKASELACPHVALIPYWDSADDLGKPEKVSHYICQGCKTSFSAEVGERLKAEEAERLRITNIERLKPQR